MQLACGGCKELWSHVVTICGHLLCSNCARKIVRGKCPGCRKKIVAGDLIEIVRRHTNVWNSSDGRVKMERVKHDIRVNYGSVGRPRELNENRMAFHVGFQKCWVDSLKSSQNIIRIAFRDVERSVSMRRTSDNKSNNRLQCGNYRIKDGTLMLLSSFIAQSPNN
jgi:hypothetical protein